MFVGLVGLLQRPFIVVAVEDASLRLHARSFDRRRQQLYLVPELGHFLEDPAFLARMMRQYRSMKLFGSEPRLAPAEKNHRRCAAGNQLVSEHPQDARS